jgi:SAM-dependent methyltransferase
VGLSDLFSRRRKDNTDSDAGASDAPAHPTKALPKFLATLNQRQQPLLLDLGPVVGQTLTFFGEQLGCKIFVEDLAKDIDRQAKEGKPEDPAAFYAQRFPQETGSIDGILCWDLFDFIDKVSGQALAKQLSRILRPDGALLGFFNTAEPAPGTKPHYTRYVVVDPSHLQHRPYSGQQPRLKPLNNRDIQRMFEPLRVTEQFLLKSTMREVLFRKPSA